MARLLRALAAAIVAAATVACDGPEPVQRQVQSAELTGVWLTLNFSTIWQVGKAKATKQHPALLKLVLHPDLSCEIGETVLRHALDCVQVHRAAEIGAAQCAWNHGAWPGGHGVTLRLGVPNSGKPFTDVPLWVMSDGEQLSLGRGCEAVHREFMLTRP
jgi:hypothetical protein